LFFSYSTPFSKKDKVVKRYKSLILLMVLVLAVVSLYVLNQNREGTLKGTHVMDFVKEIKSEPKADFVFETVKGKKIEIDVQDKIFKVKGMEDKTIFLKVFGWDCKYCKKEIPELINLKNKLGDAFEVIAVEAQQHSEEASLKYMKALGINYHIVSGTSQAEFYAYLQKKYGWTGVIPLTIVIGKGGNVLAFEIGAKSYSLSELMKATLLKK